MRPIMNTLRPGLFPFLLGIFFIIFSEIYYLLDLPSPSEISEILKNHYNQYGLSVVFLGAFIEAIFMLSFYLPGSLIILLSILAIGDTPSELINIGVMMYTGALSGFVVDYWIGRFGLHTLFEKIRGKQSIYKAEKWSKKWGKWTSLAFGFHPNFLSLVCVYRGIAKDQFLRVVLDAAISLFIWVPISILLIFFLVSEISATSNSQHWYVFIAFMVWSALLCVIEAAKNMRSKNTSS